MLYCKTYQPVVRRIPEHFPLCYVIFVEALKLIADHKPDNRVFRITGLKYYTSTLVFSSRTSTYLGHHLETAFKSSEIGTVEHTVGIEDADKAYPVKVKSLGHHLCTDKDIQLPFFKTANQFLITLASPGCVIIHPPNPGFRKKHLDFFLHFLSTKTHCPEGGGTACTAPGPYRSEERRVGIADRFRSTRCF